jgi:hypothetical protein
VKLSRGAFAFVALLAFVVLGALALVVSLLLHTTRASAAVVARDVPPKCTTTWTGTSSDDWTAGSNWSTRRVPGAGDWVCIPTRTRHLPVLVTDTARVQGVSNAGGLEIVGALDLTSTTTASSSTGLLKSFGGVSVTHALTISGPFDSVGGYVSGPGTVTVATGATWVATGGTTVTTRVINDGSTVAAGGGGLVLATGGTFDNLQSVTVGGGAGIYGSCTGHATTGGTLVNHGTLDFAPGTGNLAYLGDIEPALTCLVVQNDKNLVLSSGAAVLEQNASLDLDAGSAVSGSAPLQVGVPAGTYRNATLLVNTAVSIPSLVVDAGAVEGAGNLTLSAGLTLSGGVLSGPGAVTIDKSVVWKAAGGVVMTRLTNLGAGTVPANGALTLETAGLFINAGSLTVGDGGGIYGLCRESATSGGELVNSGTLAFAPGTGGTATIGDVETAEACLEIANQKVVNVASGTAVLYENASIAFQTGSVETGSGTLVIGDSAVKGSVGIGTVNVSAATTVTSVDVSVPGTVTGSGALTVTGSLVTTGGTLAGPGPITIGTKATWASSGAVIETNVTSEGSASVEANGSITLDTGATLSNTGTITLANDASIFGSCVGNEQTGGVVTNAGTIISAPGLAGTDYLGDVEQGENCLDVQNRHSLVLSSGTLVDYENASLDFDTGSVVSGGGTLEVGAPSATYPNGTLNVGVNSTVGSLMVGPGGTVTGAGDLVSQHLSTIGTATNGSMLAGPGSVTVAGTSATWSAGWVTVSTTVDNEGAATLQSTTVGTVAPGESISNSGGGSLSLGSGSQLVISTGASLDNAGTTTLQNSASIVGGACTAGQTPGQVTNSGTLAFTPGAGNSAEIGSTPDPNCLEVMDSGPITIASEATAMVFEGTSLVLQTGASVSGPGTLSVGGYESGSLTVDAAATVANLSVGNGAVEGSGALTISGSLVTGAPTGGGTGAVLAGPGTITLANGATWTANGGTVATALTDDGSATVTGNSSLTLASGADVSVYGSFTVASGAAVNGSCTGSSTQPGMLVNTSGGTLNFDTSVIGQDAILGDVETEEPCLDVQDAGVLDVTGPGSLEVYQQASLLLEQGASVTGQGAVVIAQGATTPAVGLLAVSNGASVSMPDLTVAAGTVRIGNNATLAVSNTLTTDAGGTITGPASGLGGLTVENTWTVGGGTLAPNVNVTVSASAAATLQGTAPLVVESAATITNDGTLTLTGAVEIQGSCLGNSTVPGVVANAPSATIGIDPGIGNSAFFESFEPAKACLDLQNSGTLDLEGTTEVAYSAILEQESGSSVTGPGPLEVFATLDFNGNSSVSNLALENGTINIASNATASVGTIEGDPTTQGSAPAGYLNIGMTSGTGGVSSGQLAVTGSGAVNAGAIALVLMPSGFSPSCGTQVTALSAATGTVTQNFQGVSSVPANNWILEGGSGGTSAGAMLQC